MNWNEEIKKLRKQKGLSQTQLAKLLGRSQKLVSKWENGETVPRGANAVALSSLMGIDLALLVLTEKSKIPSKLAS